MWLIDSPLRNDYSGMYRFVVLSFSRGLESNFEISRDQARDCMERMVKEGLLTKVSTGMDILYVPPPTSRSTVAMRCSRRYSISDVLGNGRMGKVGTCIVLNI